MKMKKNIRKGLAIISVIVIVLGIVCGIGVANDILNLVSSNNSIYIDGSDVTGISQLSQLFGMFGATILGVMVAFCGFGIVAVIWAAYIVVALLIKLIRYIIRRNAEKSAVLPNAVP